MSTSTSDHTTIVFPFVIKDDFEQPPPPETKGNASLIDVSHWQGNVDYTSVYRSGVRGVYIKACEGMYYYPGAFEDGKYKQNMANSKQAGLLRGAYHFARPQYSVTRQVDYFAPRTMDCELPPALDLERDGGLTPYQLHIWVMSFINGLKAKTGRTAVVFYSNGNYCQKLPRVAPYVHLWLSQPLPGGATNPSPSPILPPGWPRWFFFQYSWKGRVPGVPADVDLDWFNGNVSDLTNYASLY